jgi:hypothetical protein
MKKLLKLIPILIHRVTGWLPFQPKTGKVQFANIGEGTYDQGRKTYLADSAAALTPGVHYLLYKKSTSPPAGGAAADYCTLCSATSDIPLGSSDDAPDFLGMPTAINLFGATVGTHRVVTDGTIADGDYVMPSSVSVTPPGAGAATTGAVGKFVASGGNRLIGKAVIPSDCTANAGDTITIIPQLPINNPGV